VAELAARQHGVVSIAQLRALSVDANAVKYRLRAGRLHRVHRGVYAVGHTRLSREGHYLAAVLACGPGAVLSHRAAGALLGLIISDRSRIDVTVPAPLRPRSGIDLHRTRCLEANDITEKKGIPTTTPARTIQDLADVLPERRLEKAIAQAQILHHLDPDSLIAQLNGRHGASKLQRALATDPQRTRSELEDLFLGLCKSARRPRPEVNATIHTREGPIEADFCWPEHRLSIETDGHAFHANRHAFENDRLRDELLTAEGWRVVRLTWRRIERDPPGVIETLGRLLPEPAEQTA